MFLMPHVPKNIYPTVQSTGSTSLHALYNVQYGSIGVSGYSGYSGYNGVTGDQGLSGYSGYSGAIGINGVDGTSGYSGFSGISGYSGFSGISGYSGFSGISGYSGFSGISGYSGFSGISGYSGFSGISGYSGFSGISGYSGVSSSTVVTLGCSVNGNGSVLSTGTKGYTTIAASGTIVKATLVAKETGSIVFDIKKSTYSGFPTTSSICSSAKPTLSSAQKNTDSTLTGWTTSLSAGDVLEFVVDSVTAITAVTLVLDINK